MSASIATAGAIKAKPLIPVAVSTLIIIFAMFEMIILPPFYVNVAPNQPIVNAAALGMTVKTDGADAAAGAILEELHQIKFMKKTGKKFEEGSILSAAILTKIWIDIFIGIWAFVLAVLWMKFVEKTKVTQKISAMEIWAPLAQIRFGLHIGLAHYVAFMYWHLPI